MARPKKHEHELRDQRVSPRYTHAELAFLTGQADAAGMTVSEYVRAVSLGRHIRAAPPPVSAELVRELNAVGVNLNQITKYLHSGRPLSVQAEAIFAKLDEVISRILAQADGS